MSDDPTVSTFVSLEKNKDSLTLHFKEDDGTPGSFTFGDRHGDHEYRIVGTSRMGRDYDGAPDPVVAVWLLRKGDEGTTVFCGTKATHMLSVTLSKEEAWKLTHRLRAFMDAEDAEHPVE